MSLLYFILVLVIVGVVLYLVDTYLPIDAQIKGILKIVVIIAVVIWVCYWLLTFVGGGGFPMRL